MKKNILYFLITFLFLAVACNEEEKVDFYDLGSEFLISSNAYTSLDNQVTISIENQQKNLSEVTIIHLGGLTADEDEFTSTYTSTISLTDGAGSVTLTDAQLGMTEIDWSADFEIEEVFNGKPFSRYTTITVDDPISFDDPGVTHRSDTIYHFKFAIEPATATVETVGVETKVGKNGVYAAVAGTFNAEDSIAITGTDYNLSDTLFVKVTGTVGTKTATSTAKVLFSPVSYEEVSTFALDTTTNLAYDFMLQREVDVTLAGDSADIAFAGGYSPGGLEIVFYTPANAEFVPATALDYANADVFDIEATNFGAAITNDVVTEGNVYIFRTRRGAGDYFYGIMKITKLDKPQGVLEDSYFEVEFKY